MDSLLVKIQELANAFRERGANSEPVLTLLVGRRERDLLLAEARALGDPLGREPLPLTTEALRFGAVQLEWAKAREG